MRAPGVSRPNVPSLARLGNLACLPPELTVFAGQSGLLATPKLVCLPSQAGLLATPSWSACHPKLVCLPSQAGLLATPSWSACHPKLVCLPSQAGLLAIPGWSACHPKLVCLPPQAGLLAIPGWSACHPKLVCLHPQAGLLAMASWSALINILIGGGGKTLRVVVRRWRTGYLLLVNGWRKGWRAEPPGAARLSVVGYWFMGLPGRQAERPPYNFGMARPTQRTLQRDGGRSRPVAARLFVVGYLFMGLPGTANCLYTTVPAPAGCSRCSLRIFLLLCRNCCPVSSSSPG